MSEKEVLLTKEGLEKLEAKLDYLKNVKRIEVAQRIKVALGFGDLSENSEYEDAKNEQAMVEGQIVDLEAKIRNARLFEATSNATTVDIGSPCACCMWPAISKWNIPLWAPSRATRPTAVSPTKARLAGPSSATKRARWCRCPPPKALWNTKFWKLNKYRK